VILESNNDRIYSTSQDTMIHTRTNFSKGTQHMEEKVERRFIALESKIDDIERRVRELEDITSPKTKPDVLSYLREKYTKRDL